MEGRLARIGARPHAKRLREEGSTVDYAMPPSVNRTNVLPRRAPVVIAPAPAPPVTEVEDHGADEPEEMRLNERFVVLHHHEIGRGHFAVVYKGLDTLQGHHVAIKVQNSTTSAGLKAAQAEFSLLRSFHHKNLVSVHGFHFEGDEGTIREEQEGDVNFLSPLRSYIYMELLTSGSVADVLEQFRITKGTAMPEHLIQRYFAGALDGLAHLHGEGVIHRDVKLTNMLINATGTLKLSDFGISQRISSQQDAEREELAGTAQYLAPEIVQNYDYSPASDLWALACSVLQMATDVEPWKEMGFSHEVALLNHIGQASSEHTPDHNRHPTIPHYISPKLRDVLTTMFSLNPSGRTSAKELRSHCFFKSDASRVAQHQGRVPIVMSHTQQQQQRGVIPEPQNNHFRSSESLSSTMTL